MAKAAARKRERAKPSGPRRRLRDQRAVIRLEDSTETFIRGSGWLTSSADRGAEARAEAFVRMNADLLKCFDVKADVAVSGREVGIRMKPATRIGALPLKSPLTGRPNLGLVIEPRFHWKAFGEVLDAVGMKVAPQPLALPDLPTSSRQIPVWVFSAIVLRRMRALLDATIRRFELREVDLASPRGAVRWDEYARRRLPSARWTSVPCRAPELTADRDLLSAIHYTVRQHQMALLPLRGASRVTRTLLAEAELLLARLAPYPALRPLPTTLSAMQTRPFDEVVRRAVREGLQAIEWTSEERGLGGLSDLAGLPFHLDMERFFEAWAATVAGRLAKMVGGSILEQSPIHLRWDPPWAGSSRRLIPNVVVRAGDTVLVIDSKYKRYGEEILAQRWASMPNEQRERHLADIHQVLAYAGVFEAKRVVACLLYPCSVERFARLERDGAVVRRARVATFPRHLEFAVAALPMSGEVEGAARGLKSMIAAA